MRRIEFGSSHSLTERMLGFAKLGPRRGVNNIVLGEPVGEEGNLSFHCFLGIFPLSRGSLQFVVATDLPPAQLLESYSRILRMEVGVDDEPEFNGNRHSRVLNQDRSMRNGWPIATLMFGENLDTGGEVAMLSSITGMSSSTALAMIKRFVRREIAGSN